MKRKSHSKVLTAVALIFGLMGGPAALGQHEGHGAKQPAPQAKKRAAPRGRTKTTPQAQKRSATHEHQQVGQTPSQGQSAGPADPAGRQHQMQHQGMPAGAPNKQGMPAQHQGMSMPAMNIPPHALALAHRENIAAFARVLRQQVEQTGAVEGDFARDAVAEMRRSFDQMERYRQEQMDLMQDPTRPQTSPPQGGTGTQAGVMRGMSHQAGAMRGGMISPAAGTWQQAEPRLSQLGAHLAELERETGREAPVPKFVLEHTGEILKQLDGLSKVSGVPTGGGVK